MKPPMAEQEREDLAKALHDRIDGDWLIGGGGWGSGDWVADIPHTDARISDLVRWAVNAISASDWLAARDAMARAEALREAAEDWPEDMTRGESQTWLLARADRIGGAA